MVGVSFKPTCTLSSRIPFCSSSESAQPNICLRSSMNSSGASLSSGARFVMINFLRGGYQIRDVYFWHKLPIYRNLQSFGLLELCLQICTGTFFSWNRYSFLKSKYLPTSSLSLNLSSLCSSDFTETMVSH